MHPVEHPLIKMKVRQASSHGHHRHGHGHHGPRHAFPGLFRALGCGRGRFRHLMQAFTGGAGRCGMENKNCSESKATFMRDVTFPDGSRVVPGQTLIKEWEVQNTGAQKWKEGTKLIFVDGERSLLNAVEEFTVPLAEPGQKVTVAVELNIASSLSPATHKITFQLADSNRNVFGDRYWAELEVTKEDQKEVKAVAKQDVKVVQKIEPAPAAAISISQPVSPAPAAAPAPAPAPAAPAPEPEARMSASQKRRARQRRNQADD